MDVVNARGAVLDVSKGSFQSAIRGMCQRNTQPGNVQGPTSNPRHCL